MSAGDAVTRFFGLVLVTVGGLFVLLCGGCALALTIATLSTLDAESLFFLPIPWLLAAVPLIAGWFMLKTGRHMLKAGEQPPSGDAPPRDPA